MKINKKVLQTKQRSTYKFVNTEIIQFSEKPFIKFIYYARLNVSFQLFQQMKNNFQTCLKICNHYLSVDEMCVKLKIFCVA